MRRTVPLDARGPKLRWTGDPDGNFKRKLPNGCPFEHIGNTFRLLQETQNAVAGVLQDGRASAVCGSIAGGREDGGAVPGVRYLPQNRLQALQPVPKRR